MGNLPTFGIDQYPVNDIYPSIQGEGRMTGIPMVILRLQGCQVGCPWCDTKQTWDLSQDQKRLTFKEGLGNNPYWVVSDSAHIATFIAKHHSALEWVLITGGEPARYDLAPLVEALQDTGYKVALETSGTEPGFLRAGFNWVTVSPKIDMPGKRVILSEAIASADEIKFVVGRGLDLAKLDSLLEEHPTKQNAIISLQPVSESPKATELCFNTCLQRGWNLSVQVHKVIKVA